MVFKKREIIVLTSLFFLFISMSFSSANTIIKNDWFEYDDSFVHDSDIFSIRLYTLNSLAVRKNNLPAGAVNYGECTIIYNMYEVCYEDRDYDSTKATVDGKGVLWPAIKVKFTRLDELLVPGYDVNVISSESGDKFLYEEQKAIITLENVGDLPVIDAELRITFPQNVTITNREDFIQVSNNLRKKFNLLKEKSTTFEFEYKVIGEGNKKFDYEIIHNNSRIQSGTFTVRGKKPFEITINNPSESYIRENQDLKIIIKNIHPEEDLELLNLVVEGPRNFRYLTTQRLLYSAMATYSASRATISPGNERTFSLRYRPLFAGNYLFKINTEIEQLNNDFKMEESKNIEVLSNELSAGLLFSRKKITFDTDIDLVLTLRNEHSSLSFMNVEATIISDFFNETRHVSRIRPEESVTLFEETIMPPQIKENKEYDAEVIIRYSNEAGQFQTITLSDSFEFIGNDSLIRINQKISDRNVAPGDEIIVEVTTKNLVDNFFGEVQVMEIFSQYVEIVTGPTLNTFQLGSNQERRAYLYKIRIPEQVISDKLEIKTSVFIPSLDYEINKSEIINIDVDIEDLLVEEEEEQEEEEQEEEEQEEEEQELVEEEKEESFLRKLLRIIENFFTGLFGRG